MTHSQEYAQLLLEITKLRQIISEQSRIISEQKEQIATLLKENQELKEKLGTNSSNSSKPPSHDPNRATRRSEPTGKKPGGQPGHTGHKRTIYPPEKVSKTVEVRPGICPGCTSWAFERTPVAVEIRQVIDLPEISPEITQYNIYTCKCMGCLKHVRADVPKEAERGFGPRLMGFVTMLTGEGHLTKRKICSITAHLGLKISLGALCNIHRLAGDLLQLPAEAIQQFVLRQDKLNADESGWRVQKKRCWIWIGATPKATFFKIDPSRSHQAYRRIFGIFQGVLTTDRHGAYNEHKGPKQSCLAHIDRHFEKMSERPGIDGSFGRLLEGQLDLIFGFWDEFKKGAFPRPILQEKANEHIENIKAALIFTAREAKNSKSAALAHDLLGRFPTLWTFLFVEGVEPTNNLAERGLRPAVIFRKLSGGNQSDWGARFTERLMTVVCTLKQNAMNAFTFLTEVFAAYQTARSPPIPAL
jgi:transposase